MFVKNVRKMTVLPEPADARQLEEKNEEADQEELDAGEAAKPRGTFAAGDFRARRGVSDGRGVIRCQLGHLVA